VQAGIGFSASKIAPQNPLWESVADPAPVVPAVAFIAHPAPTVPLESTTFPYNSLRAPGDVVENEYIVLLSTVSENISTAALAVFVVIAVTFEIWLFVSGAV